MSSSGLARQAIFLSARFLLRLFLRVRATTPPDPPENGGLLAKATDRKPASPGKLPEHPTTCTDDATARPCGSASPGFPEKHRRKTPRMHGSLWRLPRATRWQSAL